MPLRVENDKWIIDYDLLRLNFNNKTKFIILNSPSNPTGKIFSLAEYLKIAEILRDFPNVLVIADEVYDFCIYDNNEFVRFSTIEGFWDRTISTYSGKFL